ncbi:hypothetical protein PQE71_gp155 [Bacillus phage Izhevsk]|uniref:Uncharacterized protein n=2 Tax=Viruses TaxID=10239 RepID=A0A6H0X6J1_9CAUD|nr:hypothetical protein PQE71_gp155 [Bacillus phage Izhevsk]QBA85094.1 hypothetical protein [Bacillus phage phiIzh57]QIW89837.1 hypothetical protein Izhevsk_156 [Bacillus phage Izhevsk]
MNNGISVEFETIDGQIYVSVYQRIWDDEETDNAVFLIHQEPVMEKLLPVALESLKGRLDIDLNLKK